MFLRFVIVLIVLGLVVAGLAYLKFGQIQAQMAMFSHPQPAATVTATTVAATRWQPRLSAVGSVRAVQGVMVNNQVDGQVEQILFESGDRVKAGQPLVQLDTEVDEADLLGLEAGLRLAQTQLGRNEKLLKGRAVSQGDVDEVNAQLEQATAEVAAKRALIQKKTIRAPFDGQLGIRQVNLGQYLDAGSEIVALEALNPVFVDFSLPERNLAQIQVGQAVEISAAAYPDQVFSGVIQAISPAVDNATRNLKVRARFDNPEDRLRPGMFAKVAILLPERDAVLTLPRTAITFNTYGDAVFVIEEGSGEQAGKLLVQRRQVQTGAVRGEEVEIKDGLKPGERVVVAGHVKLQNGAEVAVVPDDAADNPGAQPDLGAPPPDAADADHTGQAD